MYSLLQSPVSLPVLYATEGNEDDKPPVVESQSEELETVADTSTPKTDDKSDEESPLAQFDYFSVLLVLYVIFVIVDTVFHITPDEPYVAALVHFVQRLTGNNSTP